MLQGSDTAWPQGVSGGSGSFVITCATRANVGLQVDSGYHQRVDNAFGIREQGHYHFNGNVSANSAEAQARFFVANLYRFKWGDLLALDSEYEQGTGTHAMNPDDAGRFFDVVHDLTNGYPYDGMAAYINRSIRSQWDWAPVWNRGVRRWIASPDGDPGNWDIWQHTDIPFDQDYANQSFAQMVGQKPGDTTVIDIVSTIETAEHPAAMFAINWDRGEYYWIPTQDMAKYLLQRVQETPAQFTNHPGVSWALLTGLVRIGAPNTQQGTGLPEPYAISVQTSVAGITFPEYDAQLSLIPKN